MQGAVLRVGDRLVFSSPVHDSLRMNLTLHVSDDDGATWEPRLKLTGDRSGYSDLAELEGARLGVLYEAGEESGDARDEVRFARLPISELSASRR